MKKAAILSITAFYLLLTTGMFVCILHCAAKTLIAKQEMQMAGSAAHSHSKDDCGMGKDCDCCKKHGSYIVKENLKPGNDVQLVHIATLTQHIQIADFLLTVSNYNNPSWTNSNAPPGKSGKAISIQFCSLLI
jgi:hypothetical protein